MMEPESSCVAAADPLIDEWIVLSVDREVGDLHVLAAVEHK